MGIRGWVGGYRGVLVVFVSVYIKPLSAFSQNTDDHHAPAAHDHGEDDEEDEEYDHGEDDNEEDVDGLGDQDKVVVFVTVFIKPNSHHRKKINYFKLFQLEGLNLK